MKNKMKNKFGTPRYTREDVRNAMQVIEAWSKQKYEHGCFVVIYDDSSTELEVESSCIFEDDTMKEAMTSIVSANSTIAKLFLRLSFEFLTRGMISIHDEHSDEIIETELKEEGGEL